MRFSTALPGEGGEITGVKNKNIFEWWSWDKAAWSAAKEPHETPEDALCKDEEAPQGFAEATESR